MSDYFVLVGRPANETKPGLSLFVQEVIWDQVGSKNQINLKFDEF